MCENNNLVILNVHAVGNEGVLRVHTYIGPIDASVIGCCCKSVKSLSLMKPFSTQNELFSDHMPLHLELNIAYESASEKILPLLPKLRWVLE